ncbi:hypothetical protein [Bartonella choladocola]|nr:hypothetical protein [Bartonella choladocola]
MKFLKIFSASILLHCRPIRGAESGGTSRKKMLSHRKRQEKKPIVCAAPLKKAFLTNFNDLKDKINGEVNAKLTAYSAPQGIYIVI